MVNNGLLYFKFSPGAILAACRTFSSFVEWSLTTIEHPKNSKDGWVWKISNIKWQRKIIQIIPPGQKWKDGYAIFFIGIKSQMTISGTTGRAWIRQPRHNCAQCRHVNKQGNENNEFEIPTVTRKPFIRMKITKYTLI